MRTFAFTSRSGVATPECHLVNKCHIAKFLLFFPEIMASRSKRRRRKGKHKQTVSVETGLQRYETFKVPRKLGPRDVGKIKYKGTKYEESDYDFLQEKIHKHARTSSFNLRKARNPLPKKPSVAEAGTPASWRRPSFFDEEVKRMSGSAARLSFLDDDRPMVVRSKTVFSDLPLKRGTDHSLYAV